MSVMEVEPGVATRASCFLGREFLVLQPLRVESAAAGVRRTEEAIFLKRLASAASSGRERSRVPHALP